MPKQNNGLKLADVDAVIEKQQSIVNWQTELRMACYDAIQAEDVQEIVKNQVAKAKQGDPNAIKFVMGQLLGGGQQVTINQVQVVTDVAGAARIANRKGGD